MKSKQEPSKAYSINKSGTVNAELKCPLQRQVQPSIKQTISKQTTNLGQLQLLDITPLRKKKEKSQTISNFLKHLQVQVNEKEERHENQSQIVSILDLRNTDSFYTHKRNFNGKSMLADSKFHIFLLTSSLQQFYTSLRDTFLINLQSYQQDLEMLTINTKKLISKYEAEIYQKTMQMKNLQLQMREQRLTNVEQKYRVETQLRQVQERAKQLEQKLIEAERKIKQEQQATRNEKNYNKELNELILKFHKKVQQLESKCAMLKNEHDQSLGIQIEKLNKKYQQLFNEQAQNYELKLENNKIKYENFIQNSMGSAYLDFSKVEGSDMTKSVSGKLEDYIWSADREIPDSPQRKLQNLCKKRSPVHERMLESTSSPKSNTSGRRFARTTKPHIKSDEKPEFKNGQGEGNIYMHSSLNQNTYQHHDKTPRNLIFEEGNNTNGRNIAMENRVRNIKSHLQSSQSDLQLDRESKTKQDIGQEPVALSGRDLISMEISKILNNSEKSPNQPYNSRPFNKGASLNTEPQHFKQSQATVGALVNRAGQLSAQNSKSAITISNGSNKNIVYIDKRLRETIA